MPLRGKKLLITSGPTRTPLDAVRYITNKATGRLGALIAEEVIRRGALVTFVYGRGSQTPVLRGPRLDHLQLVPIETLDDLIAVFRQELPKHYDALIHPIAVLDFRPDTVRPYKTGSHVEEWIVRLVPTPKAVKLAKELAPDTFLVGFKPGSGNTTEQVGQVGYGFLNPTR